jgi:sterol desaturase/sphingolipid hydroxylase (fatty acid hydroxylase superfamily)
MLESIQQYFNHIPSLHRVLILTGGLSFFWLLESAFPLFRFSYHKIRHAGVNIFFTLTTIVINFIFAFGIVALSDFTQSQHWGLIPLLQPPLWLQLILGLLILDGIGAYFVHWLEHQVPFLWRLHMVHHADTHVDTTTANRHHPTESVVRALFTMLAVLIAGAPMWIVMLYQSASALLSQFNHANISLPKWLEGTLGLIIVSPDMHKVHHHYVRPQTDSNYGNIFSFWDRLFRTHQQMPLKDLQYGLDILDNEKDESLSYQLKIPFEKKIE